jgi:hypothetical protein
MNHLKERSSPRNAAKAHRPRRRLAMTLILLGAAAAPAHAQLGGGHGSRQRSQQQTPQQSPAPPPPPSVPEPWPRLDAGSLLCKSRDGLVRFQTQLADGANVVAAAQASGCHTIPKQTGIQILDHDGSSRTQVVTTDESKESGWTNAYLPASPPTSAATGAGAGN